MMNRTEQKIFEIIRMDVAGRRTAVSPECGKRRKRLHAAYKRQARKIYRHIVEPLVEAQHERTGKAIG